MNETLRAVVVRKEGERVAPAIETVRRSQLPEGDVQIKVACTALNYSDGMAMYGLLGSSDAIYPHVPGIDFVGVVETSTHPDFKPGDRVIHTGWGVGYERWGGMAEHAASHGAWLMVFAP